MRRIGAAILLFLTAACRLPIEDGALLKVDAYAEETPVVKTAVLRLKNKKIRKNNLEYKQLYRKLAPVLERKGYRLVPENGNPAVILNLTFGVQLTNYLRYRYSIAEPSEASVDEFDAMVSSLYARTKLYSKFLRLRAVDASRPERELWKVQVVKEDAAEDFRSAQDALLYLLNRYIEKDSIVQLNGDLLTTELFQRFVQNLSVTEVDYTRYEPMERKAVYRQKLQSDLDAHAAEFKACGVKGRIKAVFEPSAFGTLLSFETRPKLGDARLCAAETLENLLPPPVGIPEHESFEVVLPAE